jgi:hypothetical protein
MTERRARSVRSAELSPPRAVAGSGDSPCAPRPGQKPDDQTNDRQDHDQQDPQQFYARRRAAPDDIDNAPDVESQDDQPE